MSRRTRDVLLVAFAVTVLALASVVVFIASTDAGTGQSLTVSNCQPNHPATTQVHVTLSDGGAMMGGSSMMVWLSADTASVPAGTVTFVASNFGRLNHELLILPVPSDGPGTRPAGSNGKIDESPSLGEASLTCGRGVGNGISPGTRSWVTTNLTPGTYELLCDMPWHYANGMFTTITVR